MKKGVTAHARTPARRSLALLPAGPCHQCSLGSRQRWHRPSAGRRFQPAAAAHSVALHEESDEDDPALPIATLDRSVAAGLRFLIPSGPAVLAILILVFIPIAILVVARLDSLGGSGTILRRDYMAVLAVV